MPSVLKGKVRAGGERPGGWGRQKGCGEDWCSQTGCKAADCVLCPRSVSGRGSLRCPVGRSAVRACDRQPSSTGRGALTPWGLRPGGSCRVPGTASGLPLRRLAAGGAHPCASEGPAPGLLSSQGRGPSSQAPKLGCDTGALDNQPQDGHGRTAVFPPQAGRGPTDAHIWWRW